MDRTSWSFNISNFISSRSKVFGSIDNLKKLLKLYRKTPACSSVFLITLQVSNLLAKNLIKKETPAPVFPCEFWEVFKNKFFMAQVTTTIVLDGTHLVAVRGLIHQKVPTRVCYWGELNWASQLKPSDQQIFSTMSRPESKLIRQD